MLPLPILKSSRRKRARDEDHKLDRKKAEPSTAFSYSMPGFVYDLSSSKWVKLAGDAFGNDFFEPVDLSCMTFNVWFKPWKFGLRAMSLFRIIEERMPSLVCLQEVTPRFLRLLASEPWVRENYFLSDNTAAQNCSPYGVLMLVSLKLRHCFKGFHARILPSRMERTLLVAKFVTLHGSIDVATSHLESLNAPHIRAEQLQTCFRELSTSEHAVFLGDLNFSDDPLEHALEHAVLAQHTDWADLGAAISNQPTASGTAYRSSAHVCGRVDRVLVRSARLRGALEMLGHQPVDVDATRRSMQQRAEGASTGSSRMWAQLQVEEAMEAEGEAEAGAVEELYPSDHTGFYVLLRRVV